MTAECRRMRRFEIKIHPIAANIESTISKLPRMLAYAGPEASLLDNAISAAPNVELATASQPPKCSRSPANTTAAIARSMGSVPTINEACETVVSESPLDCTKNCTGTPSTAAASTHAHSLRSK